MGLLILSSLALSTAASAQSEIPVCTASGDQLSPAVSGSIIVWEDARDLDPRGWDIYGYDLGSSSEFIVSREYGHQLDPSIDGSVVVWADNRNATTTGWDIYGYDLFAEAEFEICTAPGNQRHPDISGNIVVWQDKRDFALTGWDIYTYDLDSSLETPVCTETGDQLYPVASPHYIVWQDARNAATLGWDIYCYDLQLEEERSISTAWGDQYAPSTCTPPVGYMQTVAWTDLRNQTDAAPNADIYASNLWAHNEYAVCTAMGDQTESAVSDVGIFVFWADGRTAPGDPSHTDIRGVTVHHTQTHAAEASLCTEPGAQSSPAVSGSLVAWVDYRNEGVSGADIYCRRPHYVLLRSYPADCYWLFDVESQGTRQLGSDKNDTWGHLAADMTFSWTDHGAGGSFSPSALVLDPLYTAPANEGPVNSHVTIAETVTCDLGPEPIQDSDSFVLSVKPATEYTISASADPAIVASGGTSALSASASDTPEHRVTRWHWTDGGAGGAFSPSAREQNPTYTAPTNATSSSLSIDAVVSGASATSESIADVGTATIKVLSGTQHTCGVVASIDLAVVPSGGSCSASASFGDSSGHSAASWSWTDWGAGGSFSPSADVQSPTYTAPANTTDFDVPVTLTVTATCDDASPVSDSDSVAIAVEPVEHTFEVLADLPSPAVVSSGGSAQLGATYADSRSGHGVESWVWADGGAGGSFSPSADVQSPIYVAPVNIGESDLYVTLTVTGSCGGTSGSLLDDDATVLVVRPQRLAGSPQLLLEVHPNEAGQGYGGGPKLGTECWTSSGLTGPFYSWKVYQFEGSENLWIQVCAQNFNNLQNASGKGDLLQLKIDGQVPDDVWGIMTGWSGVAQWRGDNEHGDRYTLEFQPLGLSAGQHQLKLAAKETPIVWWVKVYDLAETAPQ